MIAIMSEWGNHQTHTAKLNGCTLTVRSTGIREYCWSAFRYPDDYDLGRADDLPSAQNKAENAAMAFAPE